MRRLTPRPVLKWAGGKTQLLGEILKLLPERIGTYYEPFVGGAAVFFALAAEGRFQRAVLSDRNPELVDVYLALQEDVEGLIAALHRMRHDEREYYRIRSQRPRTLVTRAARVIYLNKTGYNGLYRVNSSGQFNVPFGRYKNPNYRDEENLRAAARALSRTRLEVEDFEKVCARAEPGDAVYLDPPYVPVSRTSSFTAYNRHAFGPSEQQRLARCFADLAQRRVAALLSNSLTAETRKLYRDFPTKIVKAARPINSNSERRGAVSEILVGSGAKPSKRSSRGRTSSERELIPREP
jgi:DNA adenine methylase